MSDLSSDGKALVQAGREAERPSEADRERVLAALRARLGDAAVLATGSASSPVAPGSALASRSKFVKWGWVGPAVLVSGALLFAPRIWKSGEKTVSAPVASAVSPNAPSATASSELPSAAAGVSSPAEVLPSPSAPIAAVASSRASEAPKSAPRPRDGLAEEVALLSRAETEFRAGRPAKALLVLSEHQRKFPRGALAEERAAARIQALCALGRNDEANVQLTQLLHISPNSAHEGRARQACREPRTP
ncbi:MAG TPA: hypothetical protein VJV79_13630 [Polyangiaceae bacterium]|nr:hypothetical protein [Polyangiaceae bacterium]